jgi:hypothetical protein
MVDPTNAIWLFCGWLCIPPLVSIALIPVAINMDRKGHFNKWLERMKRKALIEDEEEEA